MIFVDPRFLGKMADATVRYLGYPTDLPVRDQPFVGTAFLPTSIQTLYTTSSTPTSGLYPAVVQRYEVGSATWASLGECWVFGLNGETLTNNTRYQGRVAATNSDGKPVFAVPVPGSSAGILTFVNERIYTADDTWSKPGNLLFAEMVVQGGGGSGGATATTSGSEYSVSGGGGAGGWSYIKLNAASLGATETVTVGAAGSAGSGGTSSFGSIISATGGASGSLAGPNTAAIFAGAGGAGGVGSGGDIDIQGSAGSPGLALYDGTTVYMLAGSGGASQLGGHTWPLNTGSTPTAGFGSGGGGKTGNNTSGVSGANGRQGVVIVREWLS